MIVNLYNILQNDGNNNSRSTCRFKISKKKLDISEEQGQIHNYHGRYSNASIKLKNQTGKLVLIGTENMNNN